MTPRVLDCLDKPAWSRDPRGLTTRRWRVRGSGVLHLDWVGGHERLGIDPLIH